MMFKGILSAVPILLFAATSFAGEVTMRQEAGIWVTRDENGVVMPHNGVCEGLPEAIAYATANSHDLRVTGGGIPTSSGADGNNLTCNASLEIPPMQGTRVYIGSVNLRWDAWYVGDGLTFDSCMMCSWEHHGQMVFRGSGKALVFNPRNLLPRDDFVGPMVTDSKFFFMTVVQFGGGPTAVDFKGIHIGVEYAFIEVNSERFHGIRNQAEVFVLNRVSARHIHGMSGMAYMNVPLAGGGNVYDIAVGGSGQGFLTNADNDEIRLTADDLGSGPALQLQPGACDNLVIRRRFDGPVVDTSGCVNRFI